MNSFLLEPNDAVLIFEKLKIDESLLIYLEHLCEAFVRRNGDLDTDTRNIFCCLCIYHAGRIEGKREERKRKFKNKVDKF